MVCVQDGTHQDPAPLRGVESRTEADLTSSKRLTKVGQALRGGADRETWPSHHQEASHTNWIQPDLMCAQTRAHHTSGRFDAERERVTSPDLTRSQEPH